MQRYRVFPLASLRENRLCGYPLLHNSVVQDALLHKVPRWTSSGTSAMFFFCWSILTVWSYLHNRRTHRYWSAGRENYIHRYCSCHAPICIDKITMPASLTKRHVIWKVRSTLFRFLLLCLCYQLRVASQSIAGANMAFSTFGDKWMNTECIA